ncbi:MAG: PHP domain-containing protein, partial [Chloroflexota bacterium]
EVIRKFTGLPQVRQVVAHGPTKASIITTRGYQVDLRIVEHEAFGSLLQHFTGSKQHNINLRERAVKMGLSLSEYGITDIKTGKMEKFATEEEFYKRQGLPYIPPEIREGGRELGLAEKRALPRLVELGDIKGDLHVHTTWSEGHESIETMAQAAKARGYQYIAITDHSVGRGIANGLDAERVHQQIEEIKRLNEQIEGIRILAGIEVDIRADGRLDFPDGVLEKLDIVVASVHSSLNQSEYQMTRRIIGAMENPNVDIIAHPTCRLLPDREPVAVDMEAIFRAAVGTNTVLEVNAMPTRLDLNDLHARRARELGVKLVISTDAHRAEHLDLMRFGVGIARRAWCQAENIINTQPLEELIACFPGVLVK